MRLNNNVSGGGDALSNAPLQQLVSRNLRDAFALVSK